LSQYLTIAVNLFIYNGKRPSSPYIAVVDVVCFTPRTDLQFLMMWTYFLTNEL